MTAGCRRMGFIVLEQRIVLQRGPPPQRRAQAMALTVVLLVVIGKVVVFTLLTHAFGYRGQIPLAVGLGMCTYVENEHTCREAAVP